MNFASSFRLTLIASVLGCTSAACSSDAVDSQREKEPSQKPDSGLTPLPDSGSLGTEPDGGDPEFPNFFAGVVEGTDARVGIVGIDYRTFRIFFCGGADTVGQLTHWFNTTMLGPTEDGYEWSGQIEPSIAEGTLFTPGGKRYPWKAGPVRWGGLPNLYEATAPCGKVGVVISPLPDTDEVHVQGACVGAVLADAKQVNPILPLTRGSDGSIEVRVEGEADIVVVKPVAR